MIRAQTNIVALEFQFVFVTFVSRFLLPSILLCLNSTQIICKGPNNATNR